MVQFAWLIPLLPLLGFIIVGVLNKRLNVAMSGGIATAAVFISFMISAFIFGEVAHEGSIPERVVLFDWISSGDLSI